MIRTSSKHYGLSVLEVIGCTAAIAGGVYVGALYTNLNLEHAAHYALVQTNMLEKVPDGWRPSGAEVNAASIREQQALAQQEMNELRNEIVALAGNAEAVNSQEALSSADASDDETPTRQCWLQLSEIAALEADLQRTAESQLTNANAAEVFALKSRASRCAAKNAQALAYAEVDNSVAKFGRQLSDWYAHNGDLYEKVVEIWETSPKPQLRQRRLVEWRRDEAQHRLEAKLIRDKAASVRADVSRRLGIELPAFATPETQPNSAVSAIKEAISG